MSQLSALIADTYERIQQTETARSFIIKWLNDGQKNACRRYLFPFLKYEQTVTTAASTATYSLEYATGIVYGVRNATTGRPLSYMDEKRFDRSFALQNASGSPYAYLLPGQSQADATARPRPQIQVYSVPSGVESLKVRSFRLPFDMSADTDYPGIDENYHEILVNYAASVAFDAGGDARAVGQRDLYETGLSEMVDMVGAQPADKLDYLRSAEESAAAGPGIVRFPGNYPRTSF